MNGITTIRGLLNEWGTRGLAAIALAAVTFLSAPPTQVRAQGTTANTYGGATIVNVGTIGLVPGQRLSVTVPNFYFQDGSVKFVKHSIKIYALGPLRSDGQSNLIYSGESGTLNELGHLFTIRHTDIRVPGEPGTNRVQLWIEVESIMPAATQEQVDGRAETLPVTLEVVEEATGRSNALGKTVSVSLRARPELAPTSN